MVNHQMNRVIIIIIAALLLELQSYKFRGLALALRHSQIVYASDVLWAYYDSFDAITNKCF